MESVSYKLGSYSLRELKGVHPDLVRVVKLAIEFTVRDFTVLDGLRTIEEQQEYVRTGVSWTMASKHLAQEDGLSHAVDLVPYINGKLRWETEPCLEVARAVALAAQGEGVALRWGGCWERLDNSDRHPALMVEEYTTRRRRQGRRPRVDMPHFELIMEN